MIVFFTSIQINIEQKSLLKIPCPIILEEAVEWELGAVSKQNLLWKMLLRFAIASMLSLFISNSTATRAYPRLGAD